MCIVRAVRLYETLCTFQSLMSVSHCTRWGQSYRPRHRNVTEMHQDDAPIQFALDLIAMRLDLTRTNREV